MAGVKHATAPNQRRKPHRIMLYIQISFGNQSVPLCGMPFPNRMSLKYVLRLTCRSEGNRTASISRLSVIWVVRMASCCEFVKPFCKNTILSICSVHVRSWSSISSCDFSMKYFVITSVIYTDILSAYMHGGSIHSGTPSQFDNLQR